jgi:hypothetical protein
VNIEGGLRLHWIVWLIMLLVAVATFIPALLILYDHFFGYQSYRNYNYYNIDPLARDMNTWVRCMTVLVGVVTLLAVAVRAATCVSGERDRQTLDGLLTTPLTASQIIGAKTLGNVTSVRLTWLWLGAIWLIALLAGGLHPFALPFLMGAWLIYAFFLSLLGTWFSVISRTSQRAIVYTLLATIGLGVGHWLPWCCCLPFAFFGPGPGPGLQYPAMFQAGLTPPAALVILSFYEQDLYRPHGATNEFGQLIGFSVCGLFLWLCATLFMWSMVLQRFRKVALRGTEMLFSAHDQAYYRYPGPPRVRPAPADERASSHLVLLDEAGQPVPRGATLIDETHNPPQPRGAILIEEIRDPPPSRPKAPDQDR